MYGVILEYIVLFGLFGSATSDRGARSAVFDIVYRNLTWLRAVLREEERLRCTYFDAIPTPIATLYSSMYGSALNGSSDGRRCTRSRRGAEMHVL